MAMIGSRLGGLLGSRLDLRQHALFDDKGTGLGHRDPSGTSRGDRPCGAPSADQPATVLIERLHVRHHDTVSSVVRATK